MASALTDEDRQLRKLRKKLRQIENLESLDRELNSEEATKVSLKAEIRKEVQGLAMKRRSVEESLGGAKRPKPGGSSSEEPLAQEEQLEISLPSTPKKSPQKSAVHATPPGRAAAADTNEAPSSTSEAPAEDEFVRVSVTIPDGGATTSTAPASKRKAKPGTRQRSQWRDKSLMAHELTGHEDLVVATAIDTKADVALSGGRDTAILVWRPSDREQVDSLRGHTSAVTGLMILPRAGEGEDVLAVSASMDCSLKIWNLTKNKLIRSIYTYNPIKSLTHFASQNLICTGTDGGKLEFFQPNGECALHSLNAHDDVVTALDSRGAYVASGARDGEIKVWESVAGSTARQAPVRCVYVSEDVRPVAEEQAAHLRCISSMALFSPAESVSECCYLAYGDAGHNIKVLDWKRGSLLYKVPNHVSDVGMTDCLRMTASGSHLLASSIDLDSGRGHVNLFQVRTEEYEGGESQGRLPLIYVCSWMDEENGRIFGLSACETEQSLSFMTGGKELKVWHTIDKRRKLPQEDAVLICPSYLPLTPSEVVDSGSSEDSDSDLEGQGGGSRYWAPRRGSSQSGESASATSGGITSWCSIM